MNICVTVTWNSYFWSGLSLESVTSDDEHVRAVFIAVVCAMSWIHQRRSRDSDFLSSDCSIWR